MDLKRLVGSAVFLTAIPLFTNGCADDLCCTDFQAGADLSNVNFEIEGEAGAQFKVLAQASADLTGAVSGAVDDVTAACRNIAADLGATSDEIRAIDTQERNARVTAMCELAKGKIEAGLSGGVTLTAKFAPPVCEASISAKANCQANCSVDAKCDIKANPPTCTGGKLEVSCKAPSCTGSASAKVECSGKCEAKCEGSCTAQGGVACEGKCEGTCEADASVAGSGAQADGTCKGTCKGTCEVTPPGVTCGGTCSGGCEGKCTAEAGVELKCDGGCDGEFEPISCKGGKLEGGCQVDAKCDANCDASVSAKASCTPPTIEFAASATANVKVQAVIKTLKVNLPQILVVLQARGQAFVDLTGSIVGSFEGSVSGDLGVKGGACLLVIGDELRKAVPSITATVSASASIAGTVGAK